MGPQPFGAGHVRGCLVGDPFGAELEERGVRVVHERNVQAVDPGHRLIGFVVVAVEVPAGGEQEVAAAHGDRVAVDDGPYPLALDDEPERVLAVPVFGGGLVRPEVLDGGPQCWGGVGGAGQAGIGQRDGPAFTAAADRDEVAGPLGERVQGVPPPDVRQARGVRLHRHQVVELGPQRRQVLPLEIVIQQGQFRAVRFVVIVGRRVHGVAFPDRSDARPARRADEMGEGEWRCRSVRGVAAVDHQ